jgi:peptide chain release factor 3
MDEVEQKLSYGNSKFSYRNGIWFSRYLQLWEQNIKLFSGDNRKNIEETIAFRMFKILN